jgi:hypothetical protein
VPLLGPTGPSLGYTSVRSYKVGSQGKKAQINKKQNLSSLEKVEFGYIARKRRGLYT